MVPETTTIETDEEIVRWTNHEFDVTVAEAEEMADLLRTKLEQSDVEAVLVDNTAANGTWPQETNAVWDELMADMYEAGLKSATLCPSVTNALQVNRLSRDNGTDDAIRAFKPDEREQAREFVGLVPTA